MLSSPVQVGILRERSAETDVLILEDQGGCGTVEENVATATALDREAEGRLDVVKDELAGAILGRGTDWACQDRVGDLVDLLRGILDQDVKASVWAVC